MTGSRYVCVSVLHVGTFQVGFPSTFLCLDRVKSLLAPMLDSTRPMDNMPLDFDLPQEDELATNVLSGGCDCWHCCLMFRHHHPSSALLAASALLSILNPCALYYTDGCY